MTYNETEPKTKETIFNLPALVSATGLAEDWQSAMYVVVVFLQVIEVRSCIFTNHAVDFTLCSHASGYHLKDAQIVRVVFAEF